MGKLSVTSVVTQVLDARPIKLDGFTMRARSVVPIGRPTLVQWQEAMAFATAASDAAPYWVGDLLNYAEDRDDWKEKLDQAKTITSKAHESLMNDAYLARHVQGDARDLAPTPSHARQVTTLDAKTQRRLLGKARDEGWSVRELHAKVRNETRPRVIDTQADLSGMFKVIYADPPWSTMPVKDLCKLPVAAHALPNAVLFLWTPTSRMLLNPGPREVLDAWGFTYKTAAVWDAVRGNFGEYVRVIHTNLVIATRGVGLPDEPTGLADSIQRSRLDETANGAKPELFREIIEKHWTGPYLELFGRRAVKGWKVFGSDPKEWATDSEK